MQATLKNPTRASRHSAEDLRQEPNYPIWTRLRTGDPSARGELVMRYTPLVKYVIRRMAINPTGVMDIDDVLAAGTIGLLHAVDRFDPDQGVRFETYALRRIRGAIIDAMRSLSPITRTGLRRIRLLEETTATLAQALGRAPTPPELACELGVDGSELGRMLVESTHYVVSLDGGAEDDGDAPSMRELLHDPEAPAIDADLFETDEIVGRLTTAVESLSERDQLVLNRYYHREHTLKEISREIAVSESRVSQIRSAAVEKLSILLRASQPAWAA
ncbi:MAG: sigma-70 family RNA polymerase sigma factor [Chloroflexi bacterium]|nr:sigma-70 family RNA polymerase sigma factor [Chloroflexota bacterium]